MSDLKSKAYGMAALSELHAGQTDCIRLGRSRLWKALGGGGSGAVFGRLITQIAYDCMCVQVQEEHI